MLTNDGNVNEKLLKILTKIVGDCEIAMNPQLNQFLEEIHEEFSEMNDDEAEVFVKILQTFDKEKCRLQEQYRQSIFATADKLSKYYDNFIKAMYPDMDSMSKIMKFGTGFLALRILDELVTYWVDNNYWIHSNMYKEMKEYDKNKEKEDQCHTSDGLSDK